MFNRIRFGLTAWYVGVVLLIVITMAAISYVMLSRSLRSEVDDSLRTSARGISSQLSDDLIEGVVAEGGREEDEREHLRFFGGSGDTFYLILSPSGELLLNPLNLTVQGIPDPAVVQEAVAEGEAWQTLDAGGAKYRAYLLPVIERGRAVAVVQVGRSLAEQDRQLGAALLALAISGAAGLALATAGGVLVAGRALKPIKQAFSRQREFVADASHELRTPLTLVRGNAEMLELSPTAKLSAEDRGWLQGIVREAEHMERLVSDLSVLARMDEGRLPLESEPVDLAEVIDEVAHQGRILAGSRPLDIQAEVTSPLVVQGDRSRLRELLLILVDNAVRVTPDGGRITIGGRVRSGHVEAQVSDTGPGISPEHQHRIFERFYRIEKSRSRAYGGSGLGLSIGRGIAEVHGGTLTVASQPGRGATFTLTLPVVPSAASSSATQA